MSATQIANAVATGAGIVGNVAGVAGNVLPYINLVAGFFPGAASVISAIQIAQPIIAKIAAVAPVAVKAIEAGGPIFEAIDKASPALLPHIKDLYAVFANADPTRPETAMVGSKVSDEQALAFAGPVLLGRPWTSEETQRWFDKASNPGGG